MLIRLLVCRTIVYGDKHYSHMMLIRLLVRRTIVYTGTSDSGLVKAGVPH
jgi:hypothetical protein